MKSMTLLRLLAAVLLLLAGQASAQNSGHPNDRHAPASTGWLTYASDFSADALGGHIVESGPKQPATGANTRNADWQYQRTQDVTGRTIVGAAVGDAIGFLAGGLVGRAIGASNCSGENFCDFGNFFLGATIGTTAMSAVGAHLGSGGRGNLALTALATVGITASLIGISALSGSPVVMISVPIGQIVTSVLFERKTRR